MRRGPTPSFQSTMMPYSTLMVGTGTSTASTMTAVRDDCRPANAWPSSPPSSRLHSPTLHSVVSCNVALRMCTYNTMM